MYPALLNRVIATVVLCSLCLQGCRSNFQVTSEDCTLKKSSKASDDAQATNHVLVLDVLSPALADVPGGRLPTATSATSSSVATSTVQIDSPTRRLAVRPYVESSREQVSSMDPGETDTKPSARSAVQTAELSSAGCLASLGALSLQSPSVFGSQAWHRYFGEVGVAPPLPQCIVSMLSSPCPFWPGEIVKDTHLLVLIPATVDGRAFTLDLLEELIQNPRGGGYSTQYFLYDDEVQRSSGDVYSSSSYWVLLTRDVLPGSRSNSYTAQQALVAAQSSHVNDSSYGIPSVLEAATAILSHYVRSGHRLYDEETDKLPSTSTRCTGLLEDLAGPPSPVTVGRFCSRGLVFLSGFDDDAEFGVSCLRRFGSRHYRPSALLHSFGAEEWRRYVGEVEAAPPLPSHIVDTLNSVCPFWPDRVVKDTHLLILIPASVNGKPFSLNLLGELIEHPRGGGYATKYRYYNSDVREQFGAQPPARSYWVLMTRDVLEGSRNQWYSAQESLVAEHASRTGLPYELPGALEAATAILLHHVRSGERLYADVPWTYTRCQELVAYKDSHYPVAVGGFAPWGLDVRDFNDDNDNGLGVACFRKF